MTKRPFGKIAFFTLLSGFCGLMLSLTGCGGGGSSGSGPTPGPASGSSFSGASVSINPTIDFLSGGAINYRNVEVGSQFPAAATATAGTYIYTPATGYGSGTLSLTVNAPVSATLTLLLTEFGTTNGNVTSFKATYNGATYASNVTAGTIVAYVPPTSGGGGAVVVPPGGVSASLRATEAGPSSPYANGSVVNFGISQTTLTFNGKTLTSPTVTPIDLSRGNYTFLDSASGLSYQVEFTGTTFNGLISVLNGSAFVVAFVR